MISIWCWQIGNVFSINNRSPARFHSKFRVLLFENKFFSSWFDISIWSWCNIQFFWLKTFSYGLRSRFNACLYIVLTRSCLSRSIFNFLLNKCASGFWLYRKMGIVIHSFQFLGTSFWICVWCWCNIRRNYFEAIAYRHMRTIPPRLQILFLCISIGRWCLWRCFCFENSAWFRNCVWYLLGFPWHFSWRKEWLWRISIIKNFKKIHHTH